MRKLDSELWQTLPHTKDVAHTSAPRAEEVHLWIVSMLLCIIIGLTGTATAQNHSDGVSWVGPDGIKYPDFTFAGYHGGADPIPNVPVVATVQGYSRQAILNAIQAAHNAGGGAVFLPAGTYTIDDHIRVSYNNIVLRGAGMDKTKIFLTGNAVNGDRSFIEFRGGTPGEDAIVENTNYQAGQKEITLPSDPQADQFLTKIAVGTYIRMTSYALPNRVKGKFQSDLNGAYGPGIRPYAINTFRIEAINGRTLTLNQPLRAYHSWTRFERAWDPRFPTLGARIECGLEDMTLECKGDMHSRGKRVDGFGFKWALNCWARRVRTIEPSRQVTQIEQSKFITVEDCEFNGTQERKAPGGVAYVGTHISWDVLMQNCTGYELRHAPNFQYYASGCVFRKLNFSHGNIESHFTWSRHNLVEECVINLLDGTAHSWKTTPIGDSYYSRAPSGNGEVIYNNDINGGNWGGSVMMGGLAVDDVIAHNRFVCSGDIQSFRADKYWPGDDIYIFDWMENLVIQNNVFCNKDIDNNAFPVTFMPGFVPGQGQSGRNNCFPGRIGTQDYYGAKVNGCAPNNSRVILKDNKFFGHAASRQKVLTPQGTHSLNGYNANGSQFSGNSITEGWNFSNPPARPTAPVPSIYEWQMQQKGLGVGPAPAPPIPVIAYTSAQAYAPVTVNFDASGSTDPDGTITNYFWDFGDGNLGSGTFFSHTYTMPGTYVVSLTLRDNDNQISTDTVSVVINAEAISPNGTDSAATGNGCLPTGWESADVGTIAVEGQTCVSNGTFTMDAAGENIWATTDAFHYTYRRLVGDGSIEAKVTSVEFMGPWAGSGVMIRESLSPDASFAMAALADQGRYSLLYRQGTGTAASNRPGSPTVSTPYWVKLTRDGTKLSAFFSTDGNNWSFWRFIRIPMADTVYVGIASFSKASNATREVVFEEVGLSGQVLNADGTAPGATPNACLPTGWLNSDIGGVGAAGSACEDAGKFEVNGAGEAIWFDHDEFHFVYQQMKGDGTIEARVASLQQAHNWTAAGVMMRESMIPGSRHAYAALTGAGRYALVYRTQTNGSSGINHSGGTIVSQPYWVRLSREGNRFTSSVSSDGVNWQVFRSIRIDMPPIIYVGMATTSHKDAQVVNSTYDNLTLNIVSPTNGTLPVELIRFDATANSLSGRVDLTWETATEVNNSHFLIERSLDGRVFGAIGQVQGAGNSSNTRTYEAYDEDPELGSLYYRLRQVDFDGSFRYSEVREVSYGKAASALLTAYPNPVTSGQPLYVSYFLPESSASTLRVISSQGQEVWFGPATYEDSRGEVEVTTEGLVPGIYYLHAYDSQHPDVHKSMKFIVSPR